MGYPDDTFIGVDAIKATGATVINIHQGVDTAINPYINYPFLEQTVQQLTNYTNWAHTEGLRVKFYYTVRYIASCDVIMT
jgi:hypothetical protein